MRCVRYGSRQPISNGRPSYSLHEKHITPLLQRVAAQVQRTRTYSHRNQRHEMLAICTDENAVLIESVLITTHRPLQRVPGEARPQGNANVNSCLHFRSISLVVPGGKLQGVSMLLQV